jgi:DNA-binding CsgD family transcriptional regulator
MPNDRAAHDELTEIAVSSEPVPECAEPLLHTLRRLVPFDSAWLALADPHRSSYSSLAGADLDESTLSYLSGPMPARDIEVTGTNRAGPPLSPSDLPYPVAELPTWAECLSPAGYHEGLAVGLFAPDGRHVGFLAVLDGAPAPPSAARRRLLGQLAPVLARAIDPMRSLLAAARLVQGATAGVLLQDDGRVDPLPGLADHPQLGAGTPTLHAARAAIAAGQIFTSFLWPLGGRHAPDGHARVTALATAQDVPVGTMGMVLVSPPGNLRGLTPRELEVLGHLIEGRSNHEIAAALVVAPRTVAAHLEHILEKLHAPTRTLAAVRSEREGLYVPAPRPPQRRPMPPRAAGGPAEQRGAHPGSRFHSAGGT